jgi:putative transport protein
MIGTLGLVLFLYTVGIQYGREFFRGLTSSDGLKANLVALAGVMLSGAASLLCARMVDLPLGQTLGLFAGSGTSTPTLQAAMAALGNDDPAVGYSVAYPLGVIGPILFLYLAFALLKPRIESATAAGLELLEIELKHQAFVGKRLSDVTAALPEGVQIVAIRRDDRNQTARPGIVMAEHDVLLAVGPTRAALEDVRTALGDVASGLLAQDRRDLDYLRVFASKPAVVGRMLSELELPGEAASVVLHVRRGDADLLARPDLVLEFGDRVGLLAARTDFGALRRFFGDSIKGTAEFSYVSIGLGMALGVLVGAVAVPLPGIGTVALGLSGVLVAALILGNLRRTGGLNWTIPLSANLVLRNLGLTLFLAQVGMSSGPKFAATVAQTGVMMLGLAAVVVTAFVLPILLLGLFVFRLPYDEVAGIVSGACGNPAILAFANKVAPTDRPDIGYATIFPGMTILKILFVNVVPAFF